MMEQEPTNQATTSVGADAPVKPKKHAGTKTKGNDASQRTYASLPVLPTNKGPFRPLYCTLAKSRRATVESNSRILDWKI